MISPDARQYSPLSGGKSTYRSVQFSRASSVSELTALPNKLRPLASDRMTVDIPPPKTTRFGTPLVLSRVHWVRPELVAEVTYLTWTADGCCATSSMKACGRTNLRARCAATVETSNLRPS